MFISNNFILDFIASAWTFLACSKNCLPIYFNYSAFFLLRSFLADLFCLTIFDKSYFSLFFLFKDSSDLFRPNIICRFSKIFYNWSNFFFYFYMIIQSSFSFSFITDLVNWIFPSSFITFSYYFINFTWISSSLLIYS